MINGYKCFNNNMTNLYGDKFEVGKTYFLNGEFKAGLHGNAFHLCLNVEDTLKYFNALVNDVIICEVIGSGKILSSWDDYYGYEKYAVSQIEIVRSIPREELIQMVLNFNEERVCRFVQLYRLSNEEIILFEEKFAYYLRILKAIEYYQKGNLDVYELNSVFNSGYSKKRKLY